MAAAAARPLEALGEPRAVVGGGAVEELRPRVGRQPVGPVQDGQEVVDHLAEQRCAPLRELGVGVDVVEDPAVLVEDVEVLAADRLQDVAALAALAVHHADPVQHRDALGTDHGAERPGGVLVVAGREGQFVTEDEVPAVGLVPDDLQQVQQLRPFGEGEGLRSVGLEQLGALVGADPAVPVAAGVVVDEDLGVPGGFQPLGYRAQRALGQSVVTVQEEYVIALNLLHARIARTPQPHVLREVNHVNARVPLRVFVENGARAVR